MSLVVLLKASEEATKSAIEERGALEGLMQSLSLIQYGQARLQAVKTLQINTCLLW
jgi:hypothetical protein